MITKPINRIRLGGADPRVTDGKVTGTVTEMKPGRYVNKGTTDRDIIIGGPTLPPAGFLSFEDTHDTYKPLTVDTAYVLDDLVAVLTGAGMELTAFVEEAVTKDKFLTGGANGKLRVCEPVSIKTKVIPFIQKGTEFDTTWDFPTGALFMGVFIEVVTNVSSGTIDVGILSGESGGDADGFVDGVSCATAGKILATYTASSDAANTIGQLVTVPVTGDATAMYVRVPKPWICNGTAKSVSYTTSAHAVAGNIHILYAEPGNYDQPIAQAMETIAAAGDCAVRSLI